MGVCVCVRACLCMGVCLGVREWGRWGEKEGGRERGREGERKVERARERDGGTEGARERGRERKGERCTCERRQRFSMARDRRHARGQGAARRCRNAGRRCAFARVANPPKAASETL